MGPSHPVTEHLSAKPVVEEVAPEATYDLRLRLLRDHLPGAEVAYPADRAPGSFHLAVREGDTIVAIASFSVEPAPGRSDEQSAVRLRGMAVDSEHQHRGLGRALIEAALERLRRDGVALCWANARVSAVPFYASLGFSAEGDEFTSLELPHRVVVLELS